jgi:hypothetical protein
MKTDAPQFKSPDAAFAWELLSPTATTPLAKLLTATFAQVYGEWAQATRTKRTRAALAARRDLVELGKLLSCYPHPWQRVSPRAPGCGLGRAKR